MKFTDFEEFESSFCALLADLLVVNEEDVDPERLLVDELDADSVSFLELAYLVKETLGVEMPSAKVDEETMSLPLTSGIERLEEMGGDETFFEFSKAQATRQLLYSDETLAELTARLGIELPAGVAGETPVRDALPRDLDACGFSFGDSGLSPEQLDRPVSEIDDHIDLRQIMGGEIRRRLFETIDVTTLARHFGGGVPPGMDPDTRVSELQVRDFFRFLTVGAMARYLWTRRQGGSES